MSWNQTPPPMSPRKPKIQQQSWDGTPTINLYEPNREFYESSPSMPMTTTTQAMKKSPTNQSRKVNYNKYCLPNPQHQMSDPGSYYSMASSSLKSPKSPNSHNAQFDFELSVTPQHSRTPLKSVASNRRFYEDSSPSDSAPATLVSSSSSRKCEFDAVSPKFDNPGERERKILRNCVKSIIYGAFKEKTFFPPAGTKKFEYFTPTEDPKMMNKALNAEMVELYGIHSKNDEANNKPTPMAAFVENQVYFATCSPRKNRNMKKRHYNVSPDGVSSLDEYTTTTITYEANTLSGGRRMSITISDGNSSSEMSSEPPAMVESLETSSLITQSTNCSRTTGSPLPSPSSGLSLATTATCKNSPIKSNALMYLIESKNCPHKQQAGKTLDSKQSQANRPKSLCKKIGEEADDVITSQENLHVDLHRRRHAINITSNPCYRVSRVCLFLW